MSKLIFLQVRPQHEEKLSNDLKHVRKSLEKSAVFNDVAILDKTLTDLNKTHFYDAVEVGQIYQERNTISPLKSGKTLCPLFVVKKEEKITSLSVNAEVIHRTHYELLLGVEFHRIPNRQLVGYFMLDDEKDEQKPLERIKLLFLPKKFTLDKILNAH